VVENEPGCTVAAASVALRCAQTTIAIEDCIMRRHTVRVLVLGRFEARYPAVMSALEACPELEIVDRDRTPDVIVELRDPRCWKSLPRGKRFPAVVVVPQLVSPCSADEILAFHADALVDDERLLADAVRNLYATRRHSKSA
jgi:hypothetical protein